jgi:hypothetical protein
VAGVQVSLAPLTWLGPFIWFGLRLLQDGLRPALDPAAAVRGAFIFVLAVEVGIVVHGAGHIVGGLLVRGPMDELLFTATRGINLYSGDQARYRGRVHLGRALGGPLLNLLWAALMFCCLPLFGSGFLADLAASLASTSLFIGAASFLPLPSVDGWVIWREVVRALLPRGRA